MRDSELVNIQKNDSVVIVSWERRERVATHATVVKTGPVWLTVVLDNKWRTERKFRRDDRTDGSGYPQWGMLYTLPEWERAQTVEQARAFLHEQGITVESSSSWRNRLPELADLIREHTPASPVGE